MGKFLVLYNAQIAALEQMAQLTPEQAEQGMGLWMRWAESCGDAIVDLGAPLSVGDHLEAGAASPSAAAPGSAAVCGFTIMQAASLAEVTALLENHPHFLTPGNPSIDVLPFMVIPGM